MLNEVFGECGVERGRNADANLACKTGGKYCGECSLCDPKGDDFGCKRRELQPRP